MARPQRILPALLPRQPPPPPPQHDGSTTFYDLPAEMRIEIYKLILANVQIHILPAHSKPAHKVPHSLVLTSRQVRNEVLPLIHNSCPISVTVTDFNFDSLLTWMARMPPDQEANLCKNRELKIELCTTMNDQQKRRASSSRDTSNSMRNTHSLRKWLHLRADVYRSQPEWKYCGPRPDYKSAQELRRRAKRAAKPREKEEMVKMLAAIGVDVPGS